MSAHDAEAATAVYRQARNVACAEFDALRPDVERLTERLGFLRRLIVAASGLVGEDVAERYDYPRRSHVR